MTSMEILYPIFAMFALTAFAVFRLGFMRRAAVKKGKVDRRYYIAFQDYEEPSDLVVASRHVVNLFEAPVLFYIVAIMIYVTDEVTWILVSLSWLYALSRYVHSYIHLYSNVVLWRFRVFAASWVLLVIIWLIFAVQILLK